MNFELSFGEVFMSDEAPVLSADSLFHDAEAIISDWRYGPDGRFWRLDRFNASVAGADGVGGVGLIGFGTDRMWAISVGTDYDIGGAFEQLKGNHILSRFERYGPVRVTWMAAPECDWDGIERYLIQRLSPLMTKSCPYVPAVKVALPPEYAEVRQRLSDRDRSRRPS